MTTGHAGGWPGEHESIRSCWHPFNIAVFGRRQTLSFIEGASWTIACKDGADLHRARAGLLILYGLWGSEASLPSDEF
jgi:hypothetical protein